MELNKYSLLLPKSKKKHTKCGKKGKGLTTVVRLLIRNSYKQRRKVHTSQPVENIFEGDVKRMSKIKHN